MTASSLPNPNPLPDRWYALAIGNSRERWAQFDGDRLVKIQVSDRSDTVDRLTDFLLDAPLYIASVVPKALDRWQTVPRATILTLDDISLGNLYPTLGIDRALAVFGAGMRWGFPALVIDAGTALTFTAVDGDRKLLGGAILPGLSLQMRSLAEGTAALPAMVLPMTLPPPIGYGTEASIQSGIITVVVAGVERYLQVWRSQYPQGTIAMTGGDGDRLLSYLKASNAALSETIRWVPQLLFDGIAALVCGGNPANHFPAKP